MRVERVMYIRCPSCRRRSQFKYVGEQKWPEVSAAELGLPYTMHLWTCKRCRTTLSELALNGAELPA